MDKQKLFIGFLESIHDQNPVLIEAVKQGYSACFEALIKEMDHTAYPESLKTKTDSELRYIMNDAHQAMKAMPDNPNNGYYADEINYCADELYRRKQKLIKEGKAKDSGWGSIEFMPKTDVKPAGKYSDLMNLGTPEESISISDAMLDR